MEFDKREMIDQLKLEIEVIQKGGYYPSVREPRKGPPLSSKNEVQRLRAEAEEIRHHGLTNFFEHPSLTFY